MNISLPGRLGLVPLGLIAWIGLATPALGAAPPNDSFASASAIPVGFNDWGTVSGTNAGATAQLLEGEPAQRPLLHAAHLHPGEIGKDRLGIVVRRGPSFPLGAPGARRSPGDRGRREDEQ